MSAKKVNVEVILRESNPQIYAMLDELITSHHPQLNPARIGLVWRKSTKADVDGRLVLGTCKKVTDFQREFMPFDFVITLNQEVWNDEEFGDSRRRALLDHELCHAEPKLDKEDLQPVLDERNRFVWRTRKHDIEEFREIVDRHGLYKQDLEAFGETILKRLKKGAE